MGDEFISQNPRLDRLRLTDEQDGEVVSEIGLIFE